MSTVVCYLALTLFFVYIQLQLDRNLFLWLIYPQNDQSLGFFSQDLTLKFSQMSTCLRGFLKTVSGKGGRTNGRKLTQRHEQLAQRPTSQAGHALVAQILRIATSVDQEAAWSGKINYPASMDQIFGIAISVDQVMTEKLKHPAQTVHDTLLAYVPCMNKQD